MSIFTHVTLGTSDLERAKSFYDAVLEPLQMKCLMDVEGKACGWGREQPQFIVLYPRDGNAASHGNGTTIGLSAPDRASIQEFHRRAIDLGATDAGAPGPRPFAPNAYAAYILDLDGNKVVASCRKPDVLI
ncbi:MAG: VOC family protein [Azoarcus sp.]|nr:VOC family protein [Azoarcus sp.]TVT53552.1 MAG: VOC family protein [Azoarcus sp. PHD]